MVYSSIVRYSMVEFTRNIRMAPRSNTRWIQETMVCRILMLMWPFGALKMAAEALSRAEADLCAGKPQGRDLGSRIVSIIMEYSIV